MTTTSKQKKVVKKESFASILDKIILGTGTMPQLIEKAVKAAKDRGVTTKVTESQIMSHIRYRQKQLGSKYLEGLKVSKEGIFQSKTGGKGK